MWSKSRLIVYREAGKCPQGGWKAASRTTLGTAIFGSELLRRFEPLGHYHRNVARSWYEPVFDSRAPALINPLRSDLSFFLHHFLSNFPTRRSVSPSWNLNLTFRIILGSILLRFRRWIEASCRPFMGKFRFGQGCWNGRGVRIISWTAFTRT